MDSTTAICSNGNGFLGERKNDRENDLKNIQPHGLITEAILEEEHLLEQKMVLEEEKRIQEIKDKEEALLKAKKKEEEKCFKRLNLLLSRSSIYVQFMAETMKKEGIKIEKKIEREKQIAEGNAPGKRGLKRKANNASPKKKPNLGVNMYDVYKKENMENIQFNDASSDNVPSNKQNIDESQPSLLCGATMRPYQLEGFIWLKTLFENAVNGILADEMGLGKTIQSIALIAHLVEMGVPGPFFICGPLSTVPNWCAEFERFTPDIPVVLYHGTKEQREALRPQIQKKVKCRDGFCYPVVVTSYSIALIDVLHLRKVQWKVLVVDEAHRIKNFQCKLIQALQQYQVVHRLLLTGTPLQNDLTELWSLLHFILPEIFNDLKVFQSWFDIKRLSQKDGDLEIVAQEQEKHIISTIHQILTPFLLRRTKLEVELALPPKKEVIVHAPMTPLQQQYYTSTLNHFIREILNDNPKDDISSVKKLGKRVPIRTKHFGVDQSNVLVSHPLSKKTGDFDFLFKDSVSKGPSEIHLKLGSSQMCLRRICCHPYLVSYPLDPATEDYLVDENIVTSSGKLLVLDCLLKSLKERGHKVLLFSQFTTMLDIIQDYCYYRGFKFCRLDGTMGLSMRQEELKAFNEDESIFIFLISTKAGGLGINLTAADTVIMYDSDWNPQNDLQAQDRCHRIGQKKPVVVYRLVVKNTIDERMLQIASAKRKLERVIIKKGRFSSSNALYKESNGITEEELWELLQASDATAFVKTDDNSVLSPEELERLLDRSDMI